MSITKTNEYLLTKLDYLSIPVTKIVSASFSRWQYVQTNTVTAKYVFNSCTTPATYEVVIVTQNQQVR